MPVPPYELIVTMATREPPSEAVLAARLARRRYRTAQLRKLVAGAVPHRPLALRQRRAGADPS